MSTVTTLINSLTFKTPISPHPTSPKHSLTLKKQPFLRNLKPLKSSLKNDRQTPTTEKIDALDQTQNEIEKSGELKEDLSDQQEVDWKNDEEFKRFMGNPSIEAAIKLEKKRADRQLKELDRENREADNNPFFRVFYDTVRDNLLKEKQRLEKVEEVFKALDLNKVV